MQSLVRAINGILYNAVAVSSIEKRSMIVLKLCRIVSKQVEIHKRKYASVCVHMGRPA